MSVLECHDDTAIGNKLDLTFSDKVAHTAAAKLS